MNQHESWLPARSEDGWHGITTQSPRITGFEVTESTGENNAPLGLDVDINTGVMNLNINRGAFIEQVFGSLIIAGGEHKGELLSQELIAKEIERGRELLEKEDLFSDGIAEEYRQYQLTISKMYTAADEKRKQLKSPVNKINKVFQELLGDTLGELISIRDKVMERTRAYKTQVELMEREAAAADNALREKTTDEILKLAGFIADYSSKHSSEIKAAIDRLTGNKFEPHHEFKDRYDETYQSVMSRLGIMHKEKEEEEAEPAAKKKEEEARLEEERVELEELRAANAAMKAEQEERLRREEKEREEAEKEKKARDEKEREIHNMEILLSSGFKFDGEAYTKGGFCLQRKRASTYSIEELGAAVTKIDGEIAAKKEREEREEEERKKRKQAEDEAAAKKEEERRKSYLAKVDEMTQALLQCPDHETIIRKILGDEIPHVTFG